MTEYIHSLSTLHRLDRQARAAAEGVTADSPERILWIQGQATVGWENLQRCDEFDEAVSVLGQFVIEGLFKELRLIDAHLDPATDRPRYLEILRVSDGEVVDPPRVRASKHTSPPPPPLWIAPGAERTPEATPSPLRSMPRPIVNETAVEAEEANASEPASFLAALSAAQDRPSMRLSAEREQADGPGLSFLAYDETQHARRRTGRRQAAYGMSVLLLAAVVSGGILASRDPQGAADIAARLASAIGVLPDDARLAAPDGTNPDPAPTALAEAERTDGPPPRIVLSTTTRADPAELAPEDPLYPGLAVASGEAANRLAIRDQIAYAAPYEAEQAPPRLPSVLTIAAPATRPAPADEPTQDRARAAGRAPTPAGSAAAAFEDRLFRAIDTSDLSALRALMANRPQDIRLDDIAFFVNDRWGTGYRPAVDYAILAGKPKVAAQLMAVGFVPSQEFLHEAIDNSELPAFKGVAAYLVQQGVNPDTEHDGMTALMHAALRGDRMLVDLMLDNGADAGLTTQTGMSAADFAAQQGFHELHEHLVLQAEAARYRRVMFGLSWMETQQSLAARLGPCQSGAEGLQVCRLRIDSWLSDLATVEAHFDPRNGDKLVALTLRSETLADADQWANGATGRERFEEVRQAIEKRLPKEHMGFATREDPVAMPFWKGLQPEVEAGRYYAYWSDEGKRRPVFIQLRLTGQSQNQGRYEILIGNPFRVS